MGNKNKKNNKQSSYIPTQEFVDNFTHALIHTLRNMLAGIKYHPKDFTAKVLKPLVPGGDLVKPASLADKEQHGPLTSEEGNLRSTQSTLSTTTPIGTSPLNDITQSEEKLKRKKLKMKSCTTIIDKGQRQVIIYFESQKDLYAAMEVPQAWKMTESHPPY
ncbi:hypothetical protein RhiirB3_390250 [Rhizophagus irregularis]|nr:hypothetical protein RhiirB3_390250 [Rhizophagus irregularis]